MTAALKFIGTILAVGVFAGVGLGWVATHYPVIAIAVCIIAVAWDSRRYAKKHADTILPAPTFAEQMRPDVDEWDELPYVEPVMRPTWPNSVGSFE